MSTSQCCKRDWTIFFYSAAQWSALVHSASHSKTRVHAIHFHAHTPYKPPWLNLRKKSTMAAEKGKCTCVVLWMDFDINAMLYTDCVSCSFVHVHIVPVECRAYTAKYFCTHVARNMWTHSLARWQSLKEIDKNFPFKVVIQFAAQRPYTYPQHDYEVPCIHIVFTCVGKIWCNVCLQKKCSHAKLSVPRCPTSASLSFIPVLCSVGYASLVLW